MDAGGSEHRVVETERLTLRPIESDDVDELHRAVFDDPEVMRYLPGGSPMPREQLNGSVERGRAHWDRQGYGVWVACDRATGRPVGHCGLRYLEEIQETELLYAFARSRWGEGLATEAGVAALAFGFGPAGLERIIALAVPENRASTRVMEKLGMSDEGKARLFELDLVRYGIARAAWAASRPDTGQGH
jgi:RimJ/RimL family protein N-acetyltransferase